MVNKKLRWPRLSCRVARSRGAAQTSRHGCRIMSKKTDPAKTARQQQSAIDAAAAMAEYRAAIVAEQAKTVRLKALRLAKEAADKSSSGAKPPQRPRKQR